MGKVQFLHTADWQIGMQRHFLSEEGAARFAQARIDVLGQLAEIAFQNQCEFVVAAGDLFESNHVDRRTVARTLKALAAFDNGIPFYVALPSTTIDWDTADGLSGVPIEERDADEVTVIHGLAGNTPASVRTTAAGTRVSNPAFDVTPARLVTGLITERGICDASEAGLTGLFPEESSG